MQELLVQLRQRFPAPTNLAHLGQQLRKTHPSSQAIWLLQQLEMYWDALRLEAFRQPQLLWFENQALQMGSRWPLAERRASQMQLRFPPGLLLEIGAGIGGDTLELGRVRELRSVERDPQRLKCLQHNLQVAALQQVEARAGDGLDHVQGASSVYADPMRRNAKERKWHNLEPDPRQIWELNLPSCLKLSPGLDENTLPADCDLDYVSHQGVCKEAVVWLPGSGQVTAWRHCGGFQGEAHSPPWDIGGGGPNWESAARTEPPPVGPLQAGMWIHEPDPAAIRAQAWLPLGGWRIDLTLALLASEPGLTSPWVQSFVVVEIGDADLKNLARLQSRYDFQPLEIKKRGFDVEPETLRKKLPKGRSGGPGVLYLTRLEGRHRAIICRRVG